MSYVYLMHLQGFYKIGQSVNPHRRAKTLFSTILPRSIAETLVVDIVYSFVPPDGNAALAERKLHEYFASKRVEGEWFELTSEDVIWFKWHAKSYVCPQSEQTIVRVASQKTLVEVIGAYCEVTGNWNDHVTYEDVLAIPEIDLAVQGPDRFRQMVLNDTLVRLGASRRRVANKRVFSKIKLRLLPL